MTSPKSLIISSPFERPTHHWRRASDSRLDLIEGRRPAGYEIFDTRNNTVRSVELKLVNRIRERVDAWREAGYPGVTAVTRALLEHWQDPQAKRLYAFYFCQLEAIETLIWHVEAPPEFKQGIAVPGDGGPFERLCNKMATGSGKTTVMAMIITWQTLNALTYPKRNKDFSRAIFIVAPGLTVKERLQVLQPGHPENYYDTFSLCPNEALRQKLNQVELFIDNWHNLMPLKDQDRSVVKKGAESDESYVRRVLGRLADYKDIVVINDEAHHAYRKPAEVKISKKDAEELGIDLDEATRWIEGLDRIHKMRRINRCFDLSATPFAPTGKTSTEAALYAWVVSDFGLNDAIEAGLVKTPRVVIRDNALPNAQTYRSKLYHIYREPEVAEDLNRRGAEPHEALPQLVQEAYTLLGADWRETLQAWHEAGHVSPPVMLTVCNRTETAARIEYYFRQADAYWPELKAPERTLRVDSKVLEKAEIGETASSDKAYEEVLRAIAESANIPETRKEQLRAMKKEELLRAIVDNVGKRGSAGQDLQNVISVAMLSEGWDAKNVTHIMGLRAFTSQLLCEQVIGRGLRRVSYDTEPVVCPDGQTRELFRPEFVNVFGVPLSIFQDTEGGGEPPPPPKPSTQIESLAERAELEISWPNVLRVDVIVRPELTVDWSKMPTLKIDPAQVHVSADLAPALGGAADLSKAVSIDLEALPEEFRLQRLLFRAAHKALNSLQHGFTGGRELLIQQLVRLTEQFFNSDRLDIPSLFHQDPLRKRILIALSIDTIVGHVVAQIQQQNSERLEPVFDPEFPIGSTRLMRTWYSTKPCLETAKSQISHAVADSTWEHYTTSILEKRTDVAAYAKNDHLGFQIHYLWRGSKRKFVPDYLIRLTNGKHLVLEIKGEDSDQNRNKRLALDAWVRAVNARGGFGVWCWDVVKAEPSKVDDILLHHAKSAAHSESIGEGVLMPSPAPIEMPESA
ncbi:type III restriction endonuclease subunit R [Burkholderia multivorans]|uniref:BPTD_3080 family restriction endonuclease n=1 Tax=Burkholderia multivorans TaxID=87883 RepID=UPI000D002619|nr:DEAD/DEAH box helicase family protein [Burkholderia multivorans]PRE26206.1 type III restriction endonuclease subunit R [Burkholderia multivorans]